MADFQERGGEIVTGKITAADVAALAANHDLMVVAVGRAGLGDLFPRLADQSPYDGPQRRVFAGLFRGIRPPSPFSMGFNIVPGQGEIFENQFLTLDGYASGLLIEAIPGGALEHLTHLHYEDDPAAFNAAVLSVVRDHVPATYARVDPATFALMRGLDTLSGSVTPIVRRGWAPLAGGKFALAVGDARITHDPLTGQGANAASRGAFSLGELVVARARAGGQFDEALCASTEQHLRDDAREVTEWSSAFLQPPPPHAIGLLVAAAQNQAVANAFADNFNHPKQPGDDAAVHDLLIRGASVDACTPDGWPALVFAVNEGRIEAVRALLDHGANKETKMTGDSALQVAAFRGNIAIARLLLERGADVNLRGGEGNTPLKTAAEQGNVELAKLFLDAGADLEYAGGIDGGTALCMAADRGHPDVVRLLLDRGSDPTTRDLQYDTALDCAVSANRHSPSEQREAAIRILQEALAKPR